MKTIRLFLLLVLLFSPMFAQTKNFTLTEFSQQNSYGFFVTNLVVDSAATKWSQEISVSNYDAESWTTYPWNYSKRETKYVSNDSLNYSVYVYACGPNKDVNANWFVIDTLYNNTTLKATGTPAVANGTANFNNKKFAYYKICIVNKAGCKKFILSDFGFYQAKRDP